MVAPTTQQEIERQRRLSEQVKRDGAVRFTETVPAHEFTGVGKERAQQLERERKAGAAPQRPVRALFIEDLAVEVDELRETVNRLVGLMERLIERT